MRTDHGITVLLTAAFVGAVLATVGVRQGMRGLYGNALGQPFRAAEPHIQALAALTDELVGQPATVSEAFRARVEDEAAAATAALAPIVEGPRLRGTFVDPLFDPAHQRATSLAQQLDALVGSVRDNESLPLLTYQLERAILLAERAGGGEKAAQGAHALWLREYARAFLAIDGEIQRGLDDLAAARAAGDREELRGTAVRLQGEVSRLTDRLRALPVPAEALDASQRYSAALPRLEAGLRALVQGAATTDERVLTDAENRVAGFLVERREVLPRMRALAAGERR